jgi:alkaline phosphatase
MLSRRRFLTSASVAAAGAALPLGPAALAAPAGGPAAPLAADRPRNVILMIPDGFGIGSITMARMALGRRLVLDSFVTGHTDTRSSDNFVTDSAAAGTALASGVRTYNGAIGLDDDRQPVASVLEAARSRGMRTGLVTTTRITHATPAAFAAHVPARSMEEEIAVHLLTVAPDVMFGGGIEFFQPRPHGSRTDDRDLLEEARDAGYTVIRDEAELRSLTARRALGVFSESHMAYELDRPGTGQPSLAEMTEKALALLDGPDGFFVMIEGGRIDHAAHGNDAAGHLGDILAYDEAVAAALAFAERDGNTLVVSVADHETGGLSIGRDGVYGFTPEVLLETRASAEGMMLELHRRAGDHDPDYHLTETVLLEHAPIDSLDDDEQARLATALQSTSRWEPGRRWPASSAGARLWAGLPAGTQGRT